MVVAWCDSDWKVWKQTWGWLWKICEEKFVRVWSFAKVIYSEAGTIFTQLQATMRKLVKNWGSVLRVYICRTDEARCLFNIFCVSKVIAIAHAHKVMTFFIFSKSFQTKKKLGSEEEKTYFRTSRQRRERNLSETFRPVGLHQSRIWCIRFDEKKN